MKVLNYLKDKGRFFIAFVGRSAMANMSISLFALFVYAIDTHFEVSLLEVRGINGSTRSLFAVCHIKDFDFKLDILWVHCA